MAALTQLLHSVILEAKESTVMEDLAFIADNINRSPDNLPSSDQNNLDKPLFHLLDKFILLNYAEKVNNNNDKDKDKDKDKQNNSKGIFFDIQYLCTLLLSETLEFYFLS